MPFLLHVAAAPPDLCRETAAEINDQGEFEMDHDPEYVPTAEEIEDEEAEEPLMMSNADKWDRFLDYVRQTSAPWPQGEADTDDYRKGRALEAFSLGAAVANDLLKLKPTMLTWVPHVMVFIVPRQMVALGDPSRRSCDACESFGAMVKKVIKHNTCRRRLQGEEAVAHVSSRRRWKQTFNKGYIEQAFARTCVREAIRHGEENAPFLQRVDARRAALGKDTNGKRKREDPAQSVREAADAFAMPEDGSFPKRPKVGCRGSSLYTSAGR